MTCLESNREDNMYTQTIMKLVSDGCHPGEKIKMSWTFIKCLCFSAQIVRGNRCCCCVIVFEDLYRGSGLRKAAGR